MYRLTSPTHTWVETLSGNTREELAKAVAAIAGRIPDNAVIVTDQFGDSAAFRGAPDTHAFRTANHIAADATWFWCGEWEWGNTRTRCRLRYHDGEEWITDRSEAIKIATSAYEREAS